MRRILEFVSRVDFDIFLVGLVSEAMRGNAPGSVTVQKRVEVGLRRGI